MIVLLGFGPTRLCDRVMSRCQGTFLYNHYPLETREAYEALCRKHGWLFFDSGGDLGLHKSFENWRAGREGTFIQVDPDSDFDPDAIPEMYRLMREHRIGMLSLMTPAVENRRNEWLVADGFVQLPTPEHMHTYAFDGAALNACGGLSEPNEYYGGLETYMTPKMLAAGYMVGWSTRYPDFFYQTPADLIDPEYALWKRMHNNGYGGSFADYLAGMKKVFCPVCTARMRPDLTCTCGSTFGVDETVPCPFDAVTVSQPFHHKGERVERMYLAILLPIGWRAQLYEMARGLTVGGQVFIGCLSGISRHHLDAQCAAYGLTRSGNLFTRTDEGVL